MLRKVRVLLLLHQVGRSGAPKLVLDAFRELKDRVDVFTVSLEDGPFADAFRELGPFDTPHRSYTLKQQILRRALRRTNDSSSQLKRAVCAWAPDLIYVNTVVALDALCLVGSEEVPVLLHVHELDSYLSLYKDRPEFRHRPERYVACSEAVRRALLEVARVPSEKVSVVHEFVRQEELMPFVERARSASACAPEPGKPFVVGGSGSAEYRKGHVLFLQMAAELKRMLAPTEQVRFVWVGLGDGYAARQVRSFARALGVEADIDFVPATNDPYSHFAEFDAFAMTSWEDPCPIVVLEAMLLGKPVVCFSGSGGAPEEVGETGLVVEGFSPAGMAHAVHGLIRDTDLRTRLGEAAALRIREKFEAAVQVPKLWDEIQSVADSASSGRERRAELKC